ncbi:hypothetical protein BASA81_001741 [Batrachochytrium salamandrivorans]|nr:hypothetical protein BASA81_001741 [Batrachochytrium salamandrivorans]
MEDKRPKLDEEEGAAAAGSKPELNKKGKPKKLPPQKQDTTLPESAPFTKQELEVCSEVLRKLGTHLDLFESAPCRDLRKIIEPLVSRQISKRSKEVGGGVERENTQMVRTRAAREQQKKHHDLELINKRTLRAERLNQMKAMTELDPRLPLIPDGSVFDGVNSSLGQTSGTSSCVVGIQNGADAAAAGLIMDGTRPEGQSTTPFAFVGMKPDELCNPRSCYVCKRRFYFLHHFYDSLCEACAKLNWEKRMQTCDLTDKYCLLTGGRVKVGYQIALKILRNGGHLVMTTRFPNDAAERFAKELDFQQWKHRVKLFGIDLRDLVAVENLCDELLRTLPRLDVIINNACQTVRRPPAYYSHLIANEQRPTNFPEMLIQPEGGSIHRGMSTRPLIMIGGEETVHSSSSSMTTQPSSSSSSSRILAAELSQVPLLASDSTSQPHEFPQGAYDVNAQQVDYRSETSWTLKLDQVSTPEAVEVFAVNSLTPFIICSKLKPLLVAPRDTNVGKYVVNVSSMEGKFTRRKDACHPHTNMAKAAMNMMTKTSAQDYVLEDIYMTSVDTGWLSIEAPVPTAVKLVEKNNFQTPIDEVDGASRVLDPVFTGMQCQDPKDRQWGSFLKDYFETEW